MNSNRDSGNSDKIIKKLVNKCETDVITLYELPMTS